MLSMIASDLRAKAKWVYDDDSTSALMKTLLTDGTLAMILYRAMQWSRSVRLSPLEVLFNKLNVLNGCIIGRGAEFGPAFVLIHSHGIVINGNVRGGAHVSLEHQVTIGSDHGPSPRLGDYVYVGAGAKIIGGVSVGSHSKVGANAVVVRDVPDHTTAVGVPARLIRKTGDTRASKI